jgi:diacylglycerol O-acyltransferase
VRTPGVRTAPAGGTELLRVQDAFFLHTDTGRVHQQVGGLAIAEPAPGGAVPLDWLRDHIARELPGWPRLRKRLAFPRWSLARPVWIDDPGFDLGWHLREATLDSPGDRAALEHYVAAAMAEPLDWRRPLWEVHLVGGLDGGRQAVLFKVHHAVADGLGTISAGVSILFEPGPPDGKPGPEAGREPNREAGRESPGPEAGRESPGPEAGREPNPAAGGEPAGPEAGREPNREAGGEPAGPAAGDGIPPEALTSAPAGITGEAVRQQLGATARLVRSGWQAAVQTPGLAWQQASRTARGVWELARAGPAPPSGLNRRLGSRRCLALGEIPLAEFRAVRRAFRATANELVLALASAMAAELGVGAGDTVRASLPVSTRRRGPVEPGSHTSALMVDLPAWAMPPPDRLAAVRQAMVPLRASAQPRGSQFVMAAAGTATPPRVHAAVSRWMYRGRWFNLIATNMPGPGRAPYFGPAPVSVAYPIVPLAEDVGLAVGAMTWADTVAIGVTTDADTVGPLPAGAIEAFWRPLAAAAGDAGGRTATGN